MLGDSCAPAREDVLSRLTFLIESFHFDRVISSNFSSKADNARTRFFENDFFVI